MSTNFPTSLDTLTNPTSTDTVAGVDHAAQHANANDAIEALQAKVGVDSSAVTTTLDYKLKNTSSVSPGHKHVIADINDLADASTTTKGLTKLSVAPASAANPIAVGDNDGRVPTQSENDALAGTSGTAVSSSNKFVDAADVSSAGASGKIVRLNGSAYPAADGSAITNIPAAIKVSQTTTTTTVTNTTTETDLVSFSLAAGTLGTSGVVWVRAYFSDFDLTNSGASAVTFKWKYGGTTHTTIALTNSGSPVTNYTGYTDFFLHGNGGTSAQVGNSTCLLTNNGNNINMTAVTVHSAANGSSSVDSTSSQTIKLTVTFGTATTANSVTMHSYVASKIV